MPKKKKKEAFTIQPPKTAQQIVDSCNALARLFYASRGYQVEEGYRFDEARHPEERGMWNQAAMAYDFIEGTSPDDARAELDCDYD